MELTKLAGDNMSRALLAALLAHAVVVLGLGFAFEWSPAHRIADHLDVVLVNWRSETTPEDPDFLAQADQQGGGERAEPSRPSQPHSAPLPNTDQGEAEVNAEAGAPDPSQLQREQLLAQQSAIEVVETDNRNPVEPESLPSAQDLIEQSLRMAQMQPETSREDVWHSKTPRRKYISANTKQYEYASYMQAWVAKVESVGNRNYPEEARKLNINGDLVLTVGVNPDGSVESIIIKRSSGYLELDRAAARIVELAAPYAPLPEHILREVDVLHITRTWRFTPGGSLR